MKNEIEFTKDAIKEIAQNLEIGMDCWYHIPTKEILSAPNTFKNLIDEEMWEDTYNNIENKMHECIKFECLETHDEFKIMESFAENEVADEKLQARLINALNQKRPFSNFKNIIDYSNYRKLWFAFKEQQYIQYVKDKLHNEKINIIE